MILEHGEVTRIVSDLPCEVTEIEHVWIPMSDGVRLSARIWMPAGADVSPVPAILEYIPYRKRDGTRVWDEPRHRYWAGHGYACIRLDIRGTGESEGLITDEYARQEQDDGVEAIAWIAAQPWCTGKVGMTGNLVGRLQLAAGGGTPAARAAGDHHQLLHRRPLRRRRALHGGCPLIDNFFWGSAFFMLMARPGDPAIQGERWRDQWRERLEHWEPVAATIWQRHPQRDHYWKHGSVCEDHADIECAVYAVGGWNDGYSNAVPRLLANLQCPKKGLVGPWGHKYPQDAIPGPSIGFLQHALRWWDHWLKDEDTGIMGEDQYTVWLDEFQTPLACLPMSKGRWVAEPAWPSPQHRSPDTVPQCGRTRRHGRPGDGDRAPLTRDGRRRGRRVVPLRTRGVEPGPPRRSARGRREVAVLRRRAPFRAARDSRGAGRDAAPFHRRAPGHGGSCGLNDLAPDGTSVRVTYGSAEPRAT